MGATATGAAGAGAGVGTVVGGAVGGMVVGAVVVGTVVVGAGGCDVEEPVLEPEAAPPPPMGAAVEGPVLWAVSGTRNAAPTAVNNSTVKTRVTLVIPCRFRNLFSMTTLSE